MQEDFQLYVLPPDNSAWHPLAAVQVDGTPCSFQVPKHKHTVLLELVPCGGKVVVKVLNELRGTNHWASELPLPDKVRYQVQHRRSNTRVLGSRGEILSTSAPYPGHPLPSDGSLLVGEEYELTVDDPVVTPSSAIFVVSGNNELTEVTIRLQPRPCTELALIFGTGGRSLPRGVRYRVSSVRSVLGEPSEQQLAASAYTRVKAFMEDNDVFFNGIVGQADVTQAWTLLHSDREKAARNSRTIDGIASILREYPSLGMQVHGQTGHSSEAPEPLASYYGMKPREDVLALYNHLARNRATACKDAFVQRGIEPGRLIVTFEAMASEPKTDFIPRPMADIQAEISLEGQEAGSAVPDRSIIEGTTKLGGVEVSVPVSQEEASLFLLGYPYVLEVFDGGPGGVAPHSQVFQLSETRAQVHARLYLQGDLRLVWLGPQEEVPHLEQHGDGDEGIEPERIPVLGAIPFTISTRRTGALAISASKTNAAHPTDVSGQGKLLQGEEYVVQTGHTELWSPQAIAYVQNSAQDTLSLHMTPAKGPPPSEPEPSTTEFVPGVQRLESMEVGSTEVGWYDERPLRDGAERLAAKHAALMHAALRKTLTDNKAITTALAGKSPAEVQLLREAYRREQGTDLIKALQQLGSKVKGKTTQLEQLLVREKGELDAIMVHFGVSRGQGAGGAIEPIYELLETLCTSLPNSLLEMRGRYLQLYNQDLVDAIRRVS